MNEEFIHYLWTYSLLNHTLSSTNGEQIHIISPGTRNHDSGPDFFNALIDIGNTRWAGNVEMHINSSDWYIHKHDSNPAYENIILHVVLVDNKPIYRKNGERIPTLELKNNFSPTLVHKYKLLLKSKSFIPCQNLIFNINQIDKINWFGRLMAERLEDKYEEFYHMIEYTKGDFLEVYYQKLSSSLGLTANSDSMEELAKITPLKLLMRHKNNKLQIEALLYGQAGLLKDEYTDHYPIQLHNEYNFLKTKYNLNSMPNSSWRFMRMRPTAFPTIRISQLANIVFNTSGLLEFSLETEDLNKATSILSASASDYWDNHYKFNKLVPGKRKRLGTATKNSILINTIIPFLFVYGKTKKQNFLTEKSMRWLTEIKPEMNKITRAFARIGIDAENALQSQAMIQLKNNYCVRKRCLDCKFGHILLNKP